MLNREKRLKKIFFLLPNSASKPVGGVKVVLEYANRLAKDGYYVSLVYAAYSRWCKFGLLHTLYYLYRFIIAKISGNFKPRWFLVDQRIEQTLVWSFDKFQYFKDATFIATAVDTAFYLNRYKTNSNNKFYFIQDFENWFVSDEFVRQTYHYDMKKIVVSTWLKNIIEDCGEQAVLVPNGFDMNFFNLSTSIQDRDSNEIICLYHTDKRKGLDVAFQAFEGVKKICPNLHVTLFGSPPKPENLADWYSYYQQPDRETFNRIYNRAAIFVGASYAEGWGLTIGEAMLCGCAVACTDNLGYLEMAKDGETALVSPVGQYKPLADHIIQLIKDNELRQRIAKAGNAFIHQMDIETSYRQFKKAICI